MLDLVSIFRWFNELAGHTFMPTSELLCTTVARRPTQWAGAGPGMSFLRRKGVEVLAPEELPCAVECLTLDEAPIQTYSSDDAAVAYVKHLSVDGDSR